MTALLKVLSVVEIRDRGELLQFEKLRCGLLVSACNYQCYLRNRLRVLLACLQIDWKMDVSSKSTRKSIHLLNFC